MLGSYKHGKEKPGCVTSGDICWLVKKCAVTSTADKRR